MNRRNFLGLITAAPAIVTSKGVFAGACDVWAPLSEREQLARRVKELYRDVEIVGWHKNLNDIDVVLCEGAAREYTSHKVPSLVDLPPYMKMPHKFYVSLTSRSTR